MINRLWRIFNRTTKKQTEQREEKPRNPLQEEAQELPRVRFNDEGEPTDSFVRQIYKKDDDDGSRD